MFFLPLCQQQPPQFSLLLWCSSDVNQIQWISASTCIIVLYVYGVVSKWHREHTCIHMHNMHTHSKKKKKNDTHKYIRFSWGRGSGGWVREGLMFRSLWKKKSLCIFKRMLLSWGWSCISLYRKKFNNINNEVLKLGFKGLGCTFLFFQLWYTVYTVDSNLKQVSSSLFFLSLFLLRLILNC